jgi:hypothetical protein
MNATEIWNSSNQKAMAHSKLVSRQYIEGSTVFGVEKQ